MNQMQFQRPSPQTSSGNMEDTPVEEPKSGAILKWILIVLFVLIVIGGLGYWIFM